MKRRITFTSALVVLGLLAIGAGAALAQDVNVNYVPGTDFSKYKTYKWVEIQGAEKPDQILDTQIKQAIDKSLAGKGFTKATGDSADLFVAYQLAVNQERQWNPYNTGGYGAWRYGGGMSTATSTTIHIGTLALDTKRPAVLLCDEPTGALDISPGVVVLEALERVNRELGTCTALITHNAAIAEMADRVIHLSDGRIAGIETNGVKRSPRELTW